ncbi:hypothetical protein Tco_0605939 [Tanacetum coccineum]
MISLQKRYERLRKIPKELRMQSVLPHPAHEQASSQLLGRKRTRMKLEPEICIPTLECNMSLPEGVPFVNNMVIEETKYEVFFTDVFGDEAFQRWSDINKVGVETLITYLVMASNITTPENARLKPKPITNVKIHPNSNPAILTIYRGNDRRNFEVHNPFKFAEFGINELDELGPIIQKKKNKIVSELMISLQKRKRTRMKLEPEICIPVLECNMSLPEGVPFVNNMVIEETKYRVFLTDLFGDKAFQRWSGINKVGVETLITYLVMASNITTPENVRFYQKLRELIAKHPDQEKLKSKRVKLEALGYKLD